MTEEDQDRVVEALKSGLQCLEMNSPPASLETQRTQRKEKYFSFAVERTAKENQSMFRKSIT